MNVGMDSQLKMQLYALWFTVSIVNGAIVHTKYTRTSGNGVRKLACARAAADRTFSATMMDASSTCTSLDLDWGTAAPSFDPGSTYFEKKRVTETYASPITLSGTIEVPIAFYAGAYIDMYIEFTTIAISYGAIKLFDGGSTMMVNMELRGFDDNVRFKTYWYGWVNHGSVTPFPFTVGPVYKITFKALVTEIQVLFDDVEVDRIDYFVSSEDARRLTFSNLGWLLHKIEFVGV